MAYSKRIRAGELLAYRALNRGLRICLEDGTEGTIVELVDAGDVVDLAAVSVEDNACVKVRLAGGDSASFKRDVVLEVRSDHEILTPPFR